MFSSSRNARAVIYYVTMVLAILVIAFKYVQTDWAQAVHDALVEVITYLAGLAGLTASQNLTPLPTPTTVSSSPSTPPTAS